MRRGSQEIGVDGRLCPRADGGVAGIRGPRQRAVRGVPQPVTRVAQGNREAARRASQTAAQLEGKGRATAFFWWLMISLISEMTDSKGPHAERGWIFFDRDCSVCASLVRRFRQTLEARGFGFAALQDPRVGMLLDLPAAELFHEMR